MAVIGAPDACICIASRATSRHTPQPMPCGSQAVTRPCWSRSATKQSSLCLCPRFSHPQKQGILLRTSGWSAAKWKTASTTSIGRAGGNGTCGKGKYEGDGSREGSDGGAAACACGGCDGVCSGGGADWLLPADTVVSRTA